MLTSLTQPARLHHAGYTGLRVLGRSSALLSRSQTQIRGFRFGHWPSHSEHESHHGCRRRARWTKHRHDAFSKILSWEKHPLAENASHILGRIVSRHWYWRQKGYDKAAYFRARSSDNPTGVRPGANIEDAERDVLEDLLFGHHSHDGATAGSATRAKAPAATTFGDRSALRSSLRANKPERRNTTSSPSARTRADSENAPRATGLESAIEPDYVIDPITNRKVPKVEAKTSLDEALTPKTFKNYRSQFADFEAPVAPVAPATAEPVHSDGAPQSAELNEYQNVRIDANPTEPATKARQPILESEDYVKNHEQSPDVPPGRDSIGSQYRYKGVFWHHDDGMLVKDETDLSRLLGLRTALHSSSCASTSSGSDKPAYSDLHKYKPVMGDGPAVAEDPSAQYNDLDKYKPIMDKRTPELEDSTPGYKDLDKYKPVMDTEPSAPEEPASKYEDLDKYKPVRHNEPDGKPAGFAEKWEYPDLPGYKAFMYNEPDGKPPGPEETGYDPAELSKYVAFRWNEPDGKPQGATENTWSPPADLGKYGPVRYNETDGKLPSSALPESPVAELQKYRPRHNEPDRKSTHPASEASASTELNKYGAVQHNEPDGKAPQPSDPVAAGLEEFDTKGRLSSQNSYVEPTAEERVEDIDLLRASDVRSSAGITSSEASKSDKSLYRAMLEALLPEHHRNSDATDQQASQAVQEAKNKAAEADKPVIPSRTYSGSYVRDFPEDFQQSWTSSTPTPAEPTIEEADAQGPLRLVSSLDRGRWPPTRSRLTGTARESAMIDPYSTTPQGLETSFAEECGGKPAWPPYVRIYGTLDSEAEPTSCEGDESSTSAGDMSGPGPGSVPAPPPYPAAATQTVYKILAYDPTMQTVNIAETASTVPDTSSALPPAEALLRLSNPTKFFSHFAPLQAQGFEIVSGSGDVLVFRKVRDVVVSPTAAKAELRTTAATTTTTSNNEQSKQQQQQQQQQKRQAVEDAVAAATSATGSAAATSAMPVNPIDMTGAPVPRRLWPASASFASPTGYMNYDPDPLDSSQLPPPPPYPYAPRHFGRSNADVRRTEDVFSGASLGDSAAAVVGVGEAGLGAEAVGQQREQQSEQQQNQQQQQHEERRQRRPSVAKRVLVGATWVAGVSYALGVMAEYFKSGGGEGGKGNKRF